MIDIIRKRLYYCCLLFLLAFFIQGYQGLFIKHPSSGLCLQSASKYRKRGSTWGPIYVVHFYNTCLHPDAQFRFFQPFSGDFVLFNIAKGGTFLATDNSGDKSRFHIYHMPQGKRLYKEFIFTNQFALTQTKAGALKLNNGYCPTPRAPGVTSNGTIIPQNGDTVYQNTNCDKEEQKFTFCSITCEGNVMTDVKCNKDQVMVIQNAVYGGRSDMKTCGYNEDTNCTVSVTCVVKRQCDGKQNCSINVNQTLFNIDPCPRKSKYLYFEFVCTDIEPVSNVTLSSSVLPNEGYLEITIDNKKNKVCDKSLDNKGKEAVCRQFGYQGVKQKFSLALADIGNSNNFSGEINCGGKEQTLSQCCFTNIIKDQKCSKFANVSCLICSEPRLENRSNFPDSIFTASNSINNHTSEKARLSSGSSWCTSSNVQSHLDIDLGVVYVINSVTIFGDALSENWVTSYKLSYTGDGKNWINGISAENKEIPGNKNAYNDASTTKLNGTRARILRFIPISSHGKRCMRVEICGHKLLPDQLKNLTLLNITSSSVAFSWIPPIIDKWEKPILNFRIKIHEEISRSVVLNIDHTNEINEKEVQGLSPYTEYEISIAAGNIYGFGEERNLTFTSAEAAPSGPPRNISVIAKNSSSLFASWIEPEKDKRNGIITNYTACISKDKDGHCFQRLIIADRNLNIVNLNHSTKYFVRVLARTKVGSGNFSESKARFTNAKPLSHSTNATFDTLSFMLELPSGNYSYFQVIALKLSDGKAPSSFPDSYSESDLVTYAEAKSSSQQPKPYIAAVLTTSTENEFKLGDGSNSSLPTRRRRRSSSGAYYNGPLDPGTSYSVFQRIYEDRDNYYSTDWSPPAETDKRPTTKPIPFSTKKTEKNLIPTIIGVVVAVVCLVLLVIAVILFKRRAGNSKPKLYEENLELPEKDRGVLNEVDIEDGRADNDVIEVGQNNDVVDINQPHDDVIVAADKPKTEHVNTNNDEDQIYSNEEAIAAQKPPIPISQFESHVENLKKKKKAGFKDEFQVLPNGHIYTWDVAKRSFNKIKNRYGNIVTYDLSRVILSGDSESDYINASFINGITENYYIATQGPKPGTIDDFWRMIFEHKCPTIVIVTTLSEMGKVKCEKYWPDDCGQYGKLKVTLKETKAFADHYLRTFSIEKDEEELEVKQFHFIAWPDHGVPNFPTQLLSFRKHYKSEHDKRTGPAVVHCSAGVGRTGVFIAIDLTIDEIERSGKDNVDIFNLVVRLRHRRTNMVQTTEQYIFIHETILDHIKCGSNEVDTVNLKIEMTKLSKSNANGETGYEEKFKCLNEVSPKFSGDQSDSGLLPENKKKNRKADIYPSEVSRVHLRHLEDVENSDYINACYVDGYLGKNYFIATQIPLKETINDFWRMIIQHNSSTIVMLNQLNENGEEYPMFWPTERAKPKSFGSVTLQLDSAKKKDEYILRKFIISLSPDLSQGRPIRLIQCISWPDHGVPNKSNDVLALLTEVETSQRAAGKGPVTVVCSDGAGRSGTYIAISNLVDRMKIVQVVDVFQCIKLIRIKRPQFVENANQYRCCYEVIDALLKSFNEYSNFEMKET